MTSRIADADENRLVFTLRFFKCFLSPREPINENRSKVQLQITGFGYSNEHGTNTCQDLAIYIVSGAMVRNMICSVCVLKVNIVFEFEMLSIIIFKPSNHFQ